MTITRKDFELLAKAIRAMPVIFRDIVAEHIATALVGHSATFDKARFLAACKPKEKGHV